MGAFILTGTVAGVVVLAMVVLAVVIIVIVICNRRVYHCVYQWRVKPAQSVGEGENKEHLYEQVDEWPRPTEDVNLKQNEAYGQIKEQLYEQVDERPRPTGDVTLKQNEAYGLIQVPNPTPTTGL